ncbi:MAG: prolyl oligopeptidase family serine peptidase, partial [Bdellovibrionales bacterium]|nr:prolyl oligopeptidase family serine peptidase [Bdellovibrionales bacterium]
GGVVFAGAINKDPGLFRSVILDVPFVDVLGAMLDTNQTLTVREREEWGDPSDKDDFDAILRYSPYENITNGLYPSVLVRAGYLDNFVSIWETAKWVSKLRAESRNPDQIYLFIRMDAGHFGASQGFEEIRDRALMYSFLISQVQY